MRNHTKSDTPRIYKRPKFIDLYPMEFCEFRDGRRDYVLTTHHLGDGLVLGRDVVLTSKTKYEEIRDAEGNLLKLKKGKDRLHGSIREVLIIQPRRPLGGTQILVRIDLRNHK